MAIDNQLRFNNLFNTFSLWLVCHLRRPLVFFPLGPIRRLLIVRSLLSSPTDGFIIFRWRTSILGELCMSLPSTFQVSTYRPNQRSSKYDDRIRLPTRGCARSGAIRRTFVFILHWLLFDSGYMYIRRSTQKFGKSLIFNMKLGSGP